MSNGKVSFFFLSSFAQESKVIYERESRSNARFLALGHASSLHIHLYGRYRETITPF